MMSIRNVCQVLLLGMAAGLGVDMTARAQTADVPSSDASNMTTQEIIDAYTPGVRGLKPGTGTATAPTAPEERPSLSFRGITFAFDSADIRPDAIEILNRIGAALASPDLSESRFAIIGHTDASGPDHYNMNLSMRRAQAVREFLVNRHDIETARLEPIGRGEQELADAGNPTSEVNRRVEVMRLAP